jgi:hypothetical protein
VPDIDGALRRALEIDEEREVAAEAARVLRVEEEEAVATEQVLDVVLRRGDQDIDADFVEQRVEAVGIEGEPGLLPCRLAKRLSCRRGAL